MTKKNIAFIFISVLLLFSCKSTPEKVLSPEQMVAILKEIHISDAILNEKRLYDKDLSDSTISYYNYIWEKHNISYGEFKKSLSYYAEHGSEMNIIYDSVISRLIFIRDSIQNHDKVELVKAGYKMNLWSQKTEWSVPQDGADNTIVFKITTNNHGLYTLNANVRMFSDDGSEIPKMTIVAYYDDDTFDANSDFNIVKDGEWHHLTAKVKTNESKKLNRIAGWILDHSKLVGSKHADVKDLELIYSSN